MKKPIVSLMLVLLISFTWALSLDDIKFCLQREYHELLYKNTDKITEPISSGIANKDWLYTSIEYAKIAKDADLAAECHFLLATKHKALDSAIQWILLNKAGRLEDPALIAIYNTKLTLIKELFPAPQDSLVIDIYSQGLDVDVYYPIIKSLPAYNEIIEELAKSRIDVISTERNDSLAMALISDFYENFPLSKWHQVAFYFELHHLSLKKDFAAIQQRIIANKEISPSHTYISATFWQSPLLRKSLSDSRLANETLQIAIQDIRNMMEDKSLSSSYQVLYDTFSASQWQTKLTLQLSKLIYYQILAEHGLYGDEDLLIGLLKEPSSLWVSGFELLESSCFPHNDSGEQAELAFWKGRYLSLIMGKKHLEHAAQSFTQCLIFGAPRKRYDLEAEKAIQQIHKQLKRKDTAIGWMRKLMNYQGIVFEDHTQQAGWENIRFSRVALGDFDNDSYADILLNGNTLYRNKGNLDFEDVSQSCGLSTLNSNGGIFADFNKDGKLDFVSISHAEDGNGDKLMKNEDNHHFVCVNPKAGDIDDKFPTEGVAWIDTENNGYPSLYMANYEKWQVRSAYPDFYWKNTDGFFTDESTSMGFRDPVYADNPGQAGRGIAPADFNNDGTQEILVTNYRLSRNFFWVNAQGRYYDLAAQLHIQGIEQQGYYGHSIGADWGDYDNDGDLDLFIANLAHPRYIEFSDISMLLRNDGMQYRVIEADTVYYWLLTDITKEAGITYDELHSDPLWFDADNDGFLDLFITSVYENDRSYLYRNNGDGTFTDVTWLSGARVYNGWGNGAADLDHDGRLDLVVGSGNGTKMLINRTQNNYKSLIIKPVWDGSEIKIPHSYQAFMELPNSPAFGCRLLVTLQDKKGNKLQQIRELTSAKGTSSQSDQVLHFGIKNHKLLSIERISYDSD